MPNMNGRRRRQRRRRRWIAHFGFACMSAIVDFDDWIVWCVWKNTQKISSNDYGYNGTCVQTYLWTKSIRPLVNFNAVSFHVSSVFWHSNRCKYFSGSMRRIFTCTHRIPILRIDYFFHFGWIRAIDNARQSLWPLRFGSRTVRFCLVFLVCFLRWMKWIIVVSRIFEHRKKYLFGKKRT